MESKRIFVVGGSSGIGEAVIKKFASEGYSAVNLSRTPCEAEGVENILCDISDREAYKSRLDEYVKEKNDLSVFVYSAGFSMAAPLQHVKEEDYRYLYEVNLFGFMVALQKFLPLLRRSGGVACIVSSIGGIQPIAYDSYYSSSKAAVNMLVNALQSELLPAGVKVISVMPGGTKTRFTYKRKIYPINEVGDYANDMFSATKALHDIEQNGMKASSVAETIYKKCTKISVAHTFASGFLNKLITFTTRFLPQSAAMWLARKIYFGI